MTILAMALASAAPDLPGRAAPAARGPAAPMSAAVAIGARWGIVTSVHRTPERNRAVGGAPNSHHLSGRAIDIARRPGVRHAEIDAAFRRAGYLLLESLDEGDHSHFAFGIIGEAPLPAPDLRKAPQLAANEAAAPACPAEHPTARRRPDRAGDCADRSEPALRLRPLQPIE